MTLSTTSTVCLLIHICKVDKDNNRELYREVFVPGVLAAFYGGYLQGNTALLKYIADADLMPVPLSQLYFDLSCDGKSGQPGHART